MPCVFLDGAAFGIEGTEASDALDGDESLKAKIECTYPFTLESSRRAFRVTDFLHRLIIPVRQT